MEKRPSIRTGECAIRASFSIKGVKLITTTGITINDANWGAEQAQEVMKWTSHSDYQAMKPYIEIAEKTKADAMKLFEQEMEK